MLFGMPYFSAASQSVSFLEVHSSTVLTRFCLQKIITSACTELLLVYPRHGKSRSKKPPFLESTGRGICVLLNVMHNVVLLSKNSKVYF